MDDSESLDGLVLDVRVFAKAVEEEFRLEFWSGYQDRLAEMNELLQRAKSHGVALDLPEVQVVPEGQKSAWGMPGTAAEQAKLREVVLTCRRLESRLEQRLGNPKDDKAPDAVVETLAVVSRICDRFHAVARQMRARYAGRDTLDIEDEYDVQDLFHALLKVHFDDIRPEEYTPSYAGGSSRTDFLLKNEKIVVEIKKTRPGLGAKDIGAQLIVDIARYAEHPDCRHLVCFVYDPEGRIANPRGLEADLEKQRSGELSVRIAIRPREG